MIPLSTLYDECIDRRKFTEQKKNPFEYIVPPPSRGSEQLHAQICRNGLRSSTIIVTKCMPITKLALLNIGHVIQNELRNCIVD